MLHAWRRVRFLAVSDTTKSRVKLGRFASSVHQGSGRLTWGNMKYFLVAISCFISFPNGFGQTPTPSPVSMPNQARIKNFGSSIKDFEKKKQIAHKTQSKTKGGEVDEVIKIKTDVVVIDVLVSDQKNNIIAGFRKEDFILTEDNSPQAIEIFYNGGKAAIPRTIVLILDCTFPQGPYLKDSLTAAKLLIDKLEPNDKMAIVTADTKLHVDFTNDKILLKRTLDSLEVNNDGNGEFHSLLAVLNEMFDVDDPQRIVVFQTDGIHGMWLKPDKDTPYKVSYSTLYNSGMKWIGTKAIKKIGFSDVKEAIERSGATVYSIVPGIRFLGFSQKEQLERAKIVLEDMNRTYRRNSDRSLPAVIQHYKHSTAEARIAGQTAMFKVAEWSGGNAGFMEKPEDAESAYSDIFTIIKNRYVIGYYPTNQNRDGKLRHVKIEVRNHPEYTITGRKAYFAPE